MGNRSYGRPGIYNEGAAILYGDGYYDRNLALARFGILPFFWIGSAVVYFWTRKYLDEPGPALAVFFFTFLPRFWRMRGWRPRTWRLRHSCALPF